MTRTRISLLTVATVLGAALPAFAQAPAPAPAPMYAPAQAPMMAPAQEAAVMPAAPMMAPRASDDMTGSVGFGVGVVAGNDLVKPDGTVMMKYWMSDVLAIVPRLDLSINKTKNVDTSWGFAPSVLADFTLLKGASTRFSAGAGLGLAFAKNQPPAVAPSTDTYVDIFVPAQLGVEHFFTRWFSMGIAANFHVIDFQKQGDGWKFGFDLSNTNYMGSLFFYTD
jgi:hypothetical protein